MSRAVSRSATWGQTLQPVFGTDGVRQAARPAVRRGCALGCQTYETRVLPHSIPGCFFFGVFSAKMLVLRSERLPGRLPPIVDGPVSPCSRWSGRCPPAGSSARSG
ncbi:DUF6529 family protein [Streptomyces shenzhenensis]|uniref:DUF6529 family protein n=1 Tax=Streptomyces shenzhenensis TaxID=943815 RepID=UPI0038D44DAE